MNTHGAVLQYTVDKDLSVARGKGIWKAGRAS